MNIADKKSNKEKWKKQIVDWRASGLSQGEYCRRNNIDSRQFSKWKLKLEDPKSEFNSFVEVPLVDESSISEFNIGIKVKSDGQIIISIKR